MQAMRYGTRQQAPTTHLQVRLFRFLLFSAFPVATYLLHGAAFIKAGAGQ